MIDKETLKNTFEELKQQRINGHNWNGQFTLQEILNTIDSTKEETK